MLRQTMGQWIIRTSTMALTLTFPRLAYSRAVYGTASKGTYDQTGRI